jgi:hypothetical protein
VKRYIPWALALVLSAAVACVAVDVVERIGTLHVLTQGYGTPDNPTRAEQQLAGANVILLMGFAVGLGTGVCASPRRCGGTCCASGARTERTEQTEELPLERAREATGSRVRFDAHARPFERAAPQPDHRDRRGVRARSRRAARAGSATAKGSGVARAGSGARYRLVRARATHSPRYRATIRSGRTPNFGDNSTSISR